MGLLQSLRRTSGVQWLYLVQWLRGIGIISGITMAVYRILYCYTSLFRRPSFCHSFNPVTAWDKFHNLVGHTSFLHVVNSALLLLYLRKAIELNSRFHWKCYLGIRVLQDIWGAGLWVILCIPEPIDEKKGLIFYYFHLSIPPAIIIFFGIAEICVVAHCYNKLDAPIILKLRTIYKNVKHKQSVSGDKDNLPENLPDFCKELGSETERKSVDFSQLPIHEKYLITPLDISVDSSKPLGGGHYGLVFQGTLRAKGKEKRKVAVKMLNGVDESTNFNITINEVKVFLYAGHHHNLVKFFGVSSDATNPRCLQVVMELCEFGSLASYLRNNSKLFVDWMASSKVYVNIDMEGSVGSLNPADLMRFSYQVASGMEYLASKDIVHGDLAARNVLLTKEKIVKITDFGLSRKLYNYEIYVKGNQGLALPWRWMSIESLEDLKFSVKSDVWSFGVMLWEIFSLGDAPFGGIPWSLNFIRSIRHGLRLDKPCFCHNDVYELMLSCWELDVTGRPTFCELKKFFLEQNRKARNDFESQSVV